MKNALTTKIVDLLLMVNTDSLTEIATELLIKNPIKADVLEHALRVSQQEVNLNIEEHFGVEE